jgi:hypothetical protein
MSESFLLAHHIMAEEDIFPRRNHLPMTFVGLNG